MNTAAPAAGDLLRFTSGARLRDTGVFYDETVTLGASSKVMPEMPIPPGDWLAFVTLMIDIESTGNSASVASVDADAPFNVFNEVGFLDAAGNAVHSVTGYNLFLKNLLGGYGWNDDPRLSTEYTALTTGGGDTAGSGKFLIRIPVEIISRDAIGAYPNGSSAAQLRTRLTTAPLASMFGTAPNGTVNVRVRAVGTGYVMPSNASPTGRDYMPEPPGAGTFQQISQMSYDLTAGTKTFPHTRKGQTYRDLILVSRDSSQDRSDAIVEELAFRVDDVASVRGPWSFLKDKTFRMHDITAANWPTGVIQVSYCHEWDGKVGGEMRDHWVPTQPGSKVDVEAKVAATGTLDIITTEVVAVTGSGVLKV